MLSQFLSQLHEAYCKLGEMQSVSSQKEHGSSGSAAERAGQTSSALLECQEDLEKRPCGSLSPVLAAASARPPGKDCKVQELRE